MKNWLSLGLGIFIAFTGTYLMPQMAEVFNKVELVIYALSIVASVSYVLIDNIEEGLEVLKKRKRK